MGTASFATDYTHHYASPLGDIILASDGESLTGLWFDGQKHIPLALDRRNKQKLPVFREADRWLDFYFTGKIPGFTPPLFMRGSLFSQVVWNILLSIPYGQTRTYGSIATDIARRQESCRMSAQAVGGAVGHNPIAIIIPCHRVVGADGSLTGYAAGLDRKRKLLELERARENRKPVDHLGQF